MRGGMRGSIARCHSFNHHRQANQHCILSSKTHTHMLYTQSILQSRPRWSDCAAAFSG